MVELHGTQMRARFAQITESSNLFLNSAHHDGIWGLLYNPKRGPRYSMLPVGSSNAGHNVQLTTPFATKHTTPATARTAAATAHSATALPVMTTPDLTALNPGRADPRQQPPTTPSRANTQQRQHQQHNQQEQLLLRAPASPYSQRLHASATFHHGVYLRRLGKGAGAMPHARPTVPAGSRADSGPGTHSLLQLTTSTPATASATTATAAAAAAPLRPKAVPPITHGHGADTVQGQDLARPTPGGPNLAVFLCGATGHLWLDMERRPFDEVMASLAAEATEPSPPRRPQPSQPQPQPQQEPSAKPPHQQHQQHHQLPQQYQPSLAPVSRVNLVSRGMYLAAAFEGVSVHGTQRVWIKDKLRTLPAPASRIVNSRHVRQTTALFDTGTTFLLLPTGILHEVTRQLQLHFTKLGIDVPYVS